MLAALNTHGAEASSDYNDSDDFPGWFGWSISDDGYLTVSYRADGDDGRFISTWKLVPYRGVQ